MPLSVSSTDISNPLSSSGSVGYGKSIVYSDGVPAWAVVAIIAIAAYAWIKRGR